MDLCAPEAEAESEMVLGRKPRVPLGPVAVTVVSSCRSLCVQQALQWLQGPDTGIQHQAQGAQVECARTGHRAVECVTQTRSPHPEDGRGSGSAGSGAAPALREAPAPEGAVRVDWRDPGGAGLAQAGAGKAQALLRAVRTGQQRHLLRGHLRSSNHGRLGVALQLPQVCGDRAAQAGLGAQDCQTPWHPWPTIHPFPSTAP